jgi:hypothetical protein
MRFVWRAMMPEAEGDLITRQSVILWMGFADPRALFPCLPTFKRVDRPIPREVSRNVVEQMMSGDQCICLHGEGGCGKTTALQELEALLPSGSVVAVFDWYRSGRYLDSDAYRHRPPDAFLQLSNDLARQLRIPLLISRSADLDYPQVFKKRLEKAAEVIASRAGDAPSWSLSMRRTTRSRPRAPGPRQKGASSTILSHWANYRGMPASW